MKYPTFRDLENQGKIGSYDETQNYFCLNEDNEYIYDIKARNINTIVTCYLSIKKENYEVIVDLIIEWIKKMQIKSDNSLIPIIKTKHSSIGVEISFNRYEDLEEFIGFVSTIEEYLDKPNSLLPTKDNISYAPDSNYINYAIKIMESFISECGNLGIDELTKYIISKKGKEKHKEILIQKIYKIPDEIIIENMLPKKNVKIKK